MSALDEHPFVFRSTAAGEVRIERGGRVVTILRGDSAAAFLRAVSRADAAGGQRLMARATGNYRRGNERVARSHPRSGRVDSR